MTSRFTIILLSLLLLACSEREKRKTIKTFSNGKIEKEAVYKNEKDTVNYIELTYFESGQIKTIIDFHDGFFNGKIIEFYETGFKKFEGTTQMSFFTGVKINYNKNGKIFSIDSLLTKCKATNCCCDAIHTEYYDNGKIATRQVMLNDNVEGTLLFWDEGGKLKKEMLYHLGIADGPAVEYYDTFTVHGQYLKGKEEGEWKYIDTAGRLIKVENYSNGILKQ